MELSRSDFQILNVLKEHQCTNYQESMTLQEIIPELPMVDTVSVLDTTSYAVKKLVDNDT